MKATPARTLVVWCPDWPLTAAGVDPAAPAAVVHANRVVACSAAARAEGVRRGLRRREAQARSPDLVILAPDPARDARAFEAVAAAVEAITPRVEVVRPGVCAFPTRGPVRLAGGDASLAARVADTVAAALGRGRCQVGIADGPFAAGQAARQGRIVPPGESATFLAPLPVAVLGRPELADLLRRLGLRTLGAFAALAEADVLARFGRDGVLAHRLARGLDERPLAPRRPPPDLAAGMELDPPAERIDAVAFAARALAVDLHERMAALGLASTLLAVEVETEHGEHRRRLWRHERFDATAVAERVRWQLDGWLNGPWAVRPTGGITLLKIVPDEVVPDDGRQLGFWGGSTAATERAARAAARLQGLLGPEAVSVVEPRGGRAPAERAVLVPWGLGSGDGSAALSDEPWPGRIPPPSPADVPPSPRPAELQSADGGQVGVTGRGLLTATPARLSLEGGRWCDVTAWTAPWPADERWWDRQARRRRARFQVVTATGEAHLLALEGGRWWVEATYD